MTLRFVPPSAAPSLDTDQAKSISTPTAFVDTQYEILMQKILNEGRHKSDRTGTGTLNLFGTTLRYDLNNGFPLITTKKVFFKGVVVELNWMLRGLTNTQYLEERGVKIWTANADENSSWLSNPARQGPGDCGAIYGKQWRNWESGHGQGQGQGIDQFQIALDTLKKDPDSRRILVSSWNVGDLKSMSLSPCHALYQFDSEHLSVHEIYANLTVHHLERIPKAQWILDTLAFGPQGLSLADTVELLRIAEEVGLPTRRLSLCLYQRSADYFLGVPFNLASYALLTHLVALHTNHLVGDFVWVGGSTHLYLNHLNQVRTQLARVPEATPLPRLLILNKRSTIFEYELEDFSIADYDPHPAISAPMAV